MTEDIKAETTRSEKERFVAFSFAAADLLIELDATGAICFISGAAKGLTGFDAAELKGKPFVEVVAAQDQGLIRYVLEDMKEGDRITPVAAKMGKTKVTAVIGACKLPRNHGHIFLSMNVSGLPAARTVVDHRDSDTGLLDREDFLKLANDQMAYGAETGQQTELTMLHLAGTAGMGERIGETELESFLQNIGTTLRRFSLGGDSAGRLDDDKFGIVHSASIDGTVLEEKISAIAKEADPKGNITIEHNSVPLKKDNLSAGNATQALMYVINRFVDSEDNSLKVTSLTDGMNNRLETTMNRMLALKSVFQNYKFKLVYQPIVHIVDKEVHHYEVLSRFKDGESPYETVTFAEETDIIHDLDLGVAKKVKEKLLEFQGRGDVLPHLAINISGLSIESDSFVDNLMALYSDNKEVRESISLEITETSCIKDLERAERVLQAIRSNGMEISLDDMGSGSASFQYIRALTVDYVKIDGLYMKDVLTNKKDAAIMKAMSRLCHELNIGTIAEMVETKDQLHVLTVMGVTYGQGWYFGKPQPDVQTRRKNRAISVNMKRKGFANTWG